MKKKQKKEEEEEEEEREREGQRDWKRFSDLVMQLTFFWQIEKLKSWHLCWQKPPWAKKRLLNIIKGCSQDCMERICVAVCPRPLYELPQSLDLGQESFHSCLNWLESLFCIRAGFKVRQAWTGYWSWQKVSNVKLLIGTRSRKVLTFATFCQPTSSWSERTGTHSERMSLGSETRTRPQNPTYVKGVVAEAETSAKRSKLKNKPFGETSLF